MRVVLDGAELTGRARTHVVDLDAPSCTLHRAAVEPFLAMRAAAARDGIDLVPVSSFRDFSRQAQIWNAKFRGERRLLDRHGQRYAVAMLVNDPQAWATAEAQDALLEWVWNGAGAELAAPPPR